MAQSSSTSAPGSSGRVFKFGVNALIGTVVLLVILFVVNWFADRSNARIDLTHDKLYTISPATDNLLRDLKDRVTVTVYATAKDTPPEWTEKRNQLRQLLTEYRNRSRGKVQFSFKDPASDAAVQKEADDAGMQPQLMQQSSMTDLRVQQGYMGFSVEYKGEREPVPMITPSNSLEYQLTRAINKVAAVNIPTIAFMAPQGNPMMGETGQFSMLQDILEREGFKVKAITTVTDEDLKDASMVMLLDPQSLSEEALFRLDQYIMKGGKLFVATSGVQMGGGQMGMGGGPMPVSPPINSIIEHYGLRIDENLVEDWAGGIVQGGMTQNFTPVRYRNPLIFETTSMGKDSQITERLQGLLFAFTSSVSRSDKGTSGPVTVLARSSKNSRLQEGTFQMNPTRLTPPAEEEPVKAYDLIASVKGVLKSRYGMDAPPTLTNSDGTTYTVDATQVVKESSPGAEVIVAGSSLLFTDQAVSQVTANVLLPVNVAEALTRGSDILQLRGKDVRVARLKANVQPREAIITQVLILGGIPALLVIAGFTKMFMNRRRRQSYREIYAAPRA